MRYEDRPFCACGCGKRVHYYHDKPQKYLKGHQKNDPKYCACGCGEEVNHRNSTYIRGHQKRIIADDLTGMKIGKLTINTNLGYIKYRGEIYLCKCECGNEKEIRATDLRGNKIKSCGSCRLKTTKKSNDPCECGCGDFLYEGHKKTTKYLPGHIARARRGNLIGLKFGELKVENEETRNKTVWCFCSCSCGNTKEITLGNLVNGKTTSCGCVLQNKLKGPSEKRRKHSNNLAESKAFTIFKSSANEKHKQLGLPPIIITANEGLFLLQQNCSYCDLPPEREIKVGEYTVKVHGIDRIDSNKGYVKDNITTSCQQCNSGKLDYTVNEFEKWIERVYNHRVVKPNTSY